MENNKKIKGLFATARIDSQMSQKIKTVCDNNNELYNNESHFVRCAIIRLLKEFDIDGKKIR
mgnify:CR=1 FL=1